MDENKEKEKEKKKKRFWSLEGNMEDMHTSKTKGPKKKVGRPVPVQINLYLKKVCIELHFAKIKFYWAFLIQKSHISNFHHGTNHI